MILVARGAHDAASSELLQWQDISFADVLIRIRRTWTCGQVGLPKSKASKGPVPLHPLLAELCSAGSTRHCIRNPVIGCSHHSDEKEATAGPQDVCRRSLPASCSEGWNPLLARDTRGLLVDDDPRRFGFHYFRHSLASFLIRIRTDPKTVQTLLGTAT